MKLKFELFLCAFLACLGLWALHSAGQINKENANEQTDLCHDTKTQQAWIAKHGDETRCFLELKEYPHKVIGVSHE
jgi:hypothetical protein